ncbi:peptidylprolyl isomerase [Thermaurantiacus sp.]
MRCAALALLAALFLSGGAAPSPSDLVAGSPAEAWQEVPAEDLLILDFAGDRRLVIALAPAFAPTHAANVRRLVAAGWFPAHAAIVRVQENYVVQWGDPSGKAPLPSGIVPRPTDGYERPGLPPAFRPLPFADAYGATVGHAGGWAVATDGAAHWLPHCPEMVGVGRDMPPDTGTGAELYAVIGHGPRHLDRNIALVGRVVAGMEQISSLPRGTGALGFYEAPEARVPLVAARMATSLPEAGRPRIEVMRTDHPVFRAWIDARANRRDAFFIRPAGGADICNLLPPVRPAP